MIRTFFVGAALLLALLAAPHCAFSDDLALALQLMADSDYAGASIEFRRLALDASESRDKSGYYWAAAYAAWRSGMFAASGLLLDRSEETFALGMPGLLLRAAVAESFGNADEASFYYKGIGLPDAPLESVSFAMRRLAVVRLGQKDVEGAVAALAADPAPDKAAHDALTAYQNSSGKSPWLGGALGLIPGLGYAYSGEYANAVRSLFLNGLFIAGMISAADHDAWGVFAVIGFFEATWYSGSIYGGIDAAHRYNRGRVQACSDAMAGSSGFVPDLSCLPLVSLMFSF